MRLAREQSGMTLIELVLAMALALVIFGATLDALTNFTHSWTGSTERLDAQDKARVGIDRLANQLRNIASPLTSPKLLERATPYDIVFQTVGTPNGSNVTGTERVRYCIPSDPSGSASQEVLYSETQTWSTATAPSSPWSSDPSVTLPCPDSPLPSGVSSSTNPQVVASGVMNRYEGADQSAFSYNDSAVTASQLSQVYTVQIDLFLNPTPSLPQAETELRSGVFLRNQPRAPVVSFTDTPTQDGGVLLNGATSYSPDGEDLTFNWSCTGDTCPNTSALTDSSSALVDWQPGAGTYTVQLTVTDQSGLTATTTQTVTVT
jgi:prepilin-type N-terminal cleavage/methylation domain-containing protein